MVALLADENFPLPVIHALRALGHDVRTLHDYGQAQRIAAALTAQPELVGQLLRVNKNPRSKLRGIWRQSQRQLL